MSVKPTTASNTRVVRSQNTARILLGAVIADTLEGVHFHEISDHPGLGGEDPDFSLAASGNQRSTHGGVWRLAVGVRSAGSVPADCIQIRRTSLNEPEALALSSESEHLAVFGRSSDSVAGCVGITWLVRLHSHSATAWC